MAAAKHTPTPWEVNGERIEGAHFGFHIAQVTAHFHENEETQRANAAFIVRAVNSHEPLVAALREAVDALSGGLWDYCPGQDEHTKCDAVLSSCRAVLAAAGAA